MILTEQKLKETLKNKQFFNLYDFCGEENYLIKTFVKKIVLNCVFKNSLQLNYKKCYFEDFSFDDFENFVNMPAFMSLNRVFVLKYAQIKKFSSNLVEKLIKILNKMPKTTIVVITFFEKLDELKKSAGFKKLLKIDGCFVEFNFKTERWLLANYFNYLTKNGFLIDESDLLFLIRRCFKSIEKLNIELQKISAFVVKGKIKRQDILKLTREQILDSAFNIANNILQKNKKQAIKTFNRLINSGVSHTLIFGAISCCFLDLYRAKQAKENLVSFNDLLKYYDYSNKAFRIKNAFLNCNMYSITKLKRYVILMAKLDLELKTRNISKFILIEKMLFFI